MSKPETTTAKSLEEIIASIRKSLSGDGAGSRDAASKSARVEPELAPRVDTQEEAGLLTDRLAGALNGTANGAPLDDDLADILAHEAPAAPQPAPAAGPAVNGKDRREPWFLERTPGTAQGAESEKAPGEEVVQLSRPEVLRASLPPLFGEDVDHPPASARLSPEMPANPLTAPTRPSFAPLQAPEDFGKAPPAGGLATARTEPSLPLPQRPVTAEEKSAFKVDAGAGPAESGLPFLSETPKPVPQSAPAGAAAGLGELRPELPVVAAPTPASEPLLAPAASESAVAPPPAAERALGEDEVGHEAKPNGAAAPQDGASVQAAPAAPPARTLEQVVGELLEPVIRHWLESNLPRMVEKVVREEVARAIAAERPAPKA
jgi:cell pole-organizing protein PopZ